MFKAVIQNAGVEDDLFLVSLKNTTMQDSS